MEFKVLQGKEALKYWALEALERDAKNQSFTDEEVTTIFGSVEKTFGQQEGSGFLNKVLEVHGNASALTFNRSVVRALALMTREGEVVENKK